MYLKICTIVLLLVTSYTDIRKKEIYFREIAGLGLLSAVSTAVVFMRGEFNPGDFLSSLIPGILIILLSVTSREGIGLGDGIMVLLLGPILGFRGLVIGILMAFFMNSFVSGILLFIRKAGRKTRIPFVPFIAAGMGVTMFATL